MSIILRNVMLFDGLGSQPSPARPGQPRPRPARERVMIFFRRAAGAERVMILFSQGRPDWERVMLFYSGCEMKIMNRPNKDFMTAGALPAGHMSFSSSDTLL